MMRGSSLVAAVTVLLAFLALSPSSLAEQRALENVTLAEVLDALAKDHPDLAYIAARLTEERRPVVLTGDRDRDLRDAAEAFGAGWAIMDGLWVIEGTPPVGPAGDDWRQLVLEHVCPGGGRWDARGYSPAFEAVRELYEALPPVPPPPPGQMVIRTVTPDPSSPEAQRIREGIVYKDLLAVTAPPDPPSRSWTSIWVDEQASGLCLKAETDDGRVYSFALAAAEDAAGTGPPVSEVAGMRRSDWYTSLLARAPMQLAYRGTAAGFGETLTAAIGVAAVCDPASAAEPVCARLTGQPFDLALVCTQALWGFSQPFPGDCPVYTVVPPTGYFERLYAARSPLAYRLNGVGRGGDGRVLACLIGTDGASRLRGGRIQPLELPPALLSAMDRLATPLPGLGFNIRDADGAVDLAGWRLFVVFYANSTGDAMGSVQRVGERSNYFRVSGTDDGSRAYALPNGTSLFEVSSRSASCSRPDVRHGDREHPVAVLARNAVGPRQLVGPVY
jgi:hypothetical protein